MKKIVLIKNSAMGSGGVERWLQFAAQCLENRYTVYFLYTNLLKCDARYTFMKSLNVRLIDISSQDRSNEIDTAKMLSFYSKNDVDLTIVAKSDAVEHPYDKIPTPVINRVAFARVPDLSPEILHTILPSEWVRNKWIQNGGSVTKTSAIPTPISKPAHSISHEDSTLHIGFHQRVDDNIFSLTPLLAYKLNESPNVQFHIMGGSEKYKKFAKALRIKNITFHSHSAEWTEVSRFLSTLDIFAHGRKDGETYGAVFAEALIHDLPCVSHLSKIDNAHVDTVGSHGAICRNFLTYAITLRKLINNTAYRNELKRGAQDFAQRYTYDPNCAKLVNTIAEVLNGDR